MHLSLQAQTRLVGTKQCVSSCLCGHLAPAQQLPAAVTLSMHTADLTSLQLWMSALSLGLMGSCLRHL